LHEAMRDFGGFDHNAQALRIVTHLERRYAGFDGLNLSWETLEGLVKHNGPVLGADGQPTARYHKHGVPEGFIAFDHQFPLGLHEHASAEAQVAALADDIAYNAHDIDDGLRAGLFDLDDLLEVPLLSDCLREISQLWPGLEVQRVIHELGRRLITRMIEDVLQWSIAGLEACRSVDDIRGAGRTLVCFSGDGQRADAGIKGFLYPRMYRHKDVMRVRGQAEDVVRDLFGYYFKSPSELPDEWGVGLETLSDQQLARRIADYIAGMTDRFALLEHRRLFDVSPDLR
jgi:dGTPase